MIIDRRAALLAALLALPAAARASDGTWSLTVLPNASISYRGEGKVLPESYVNRFEGAASPVYRIEWSQPARAEGYWSLALWHTGEFGGGGYATERIPDLSAGGFYQENLMNVGFTNVFLSYRRPLEAVPAEALVNFSVVREIFKRKSFIVNGTDLRATGFDDVNEISAEGVGIGLAGRHALPGAPRGFFRWQTSANYYVQIFDAKTDSHAGQVWQAEGGFGARLFGGVSVEVGGLWQYWFTHAQGNRRILTPAGNGAVISWNRQETRTSGAYVRLEQRFEGRKR